MSYSIIEKKYIKEIDCETIVYSHDKTKAHILVMSNEDPHKSFCIGFRTPPHDSTGVAHILEHSVLCGSKKYPLRDPFVELAKGSLNTYLNAMTYPDKTLYPVASQNDKDFHNLMDVYLDAVFFPNIYHYKEIMMQEGWRYHLENADDPIEYKGVVYNEMKGAFSSPEEIEFRLIKETLFPDTTYAYESGGAPTDIPNLTYEDFITFHKTYYHPSNAYICLYGNMNIEETLDYIDKEYLSHFDYQKVESDVEWQKPFEAVINEKSYYSATGDKESGLFLSYNFVVGDVNDHKTMLGLDLLEYILLDTPASPLKKALIAEGIGEDVYGAFQTHLKQPIFSIIAKNVKPEKEARFYEIVDEVLTKYTKEDIPLLKGALQVKEFELRESDASGYSKGLIYSIAAMKSWIHDGSPFTYLEYEDILEALKAEGYDYYKNLIKKYLLENKHASKVALWPKVGLEEEIENEVLEKLKAYKDSLSKEEIDKLIEETKAFIAFQNMEENPECIPLLKREDLRRKAKYPRFTQRKVDDIDYVITPIFTNKIVYMNWIINIEGVPEQYIPYLGMIVGMLAKLDTDNYGYEDLSSYMDEHLGSMSFSIQALNDTKQSDCFLPIFTVRSRALLREVNEQIKLMKEVLMHTKFDNADRLLEIIREMKALMESNISSEGHRIAYARLIAHLTAAEHFDEKARGLDFYHFVCNLEKNWDSVKQETVKHLTEAHQYLVNRKRITIGLTLDEDYVDEVVPKVQTVLKTIPQEEVTPIPVSFEVTTEKEALVYPSNVNYVAKGYNFKDLGYDYHGGLNMLQNILSMGYLWTKVRVQNGAYGCFSEFRRSGNMFFVSYRDPNLDKTLQAYDDIADYLENLELTERENLQYLIGTISRLDFPYTPASEGKTAQIYYLMNVTEAELQKSRDELFATTTETLRSFAPMIRGCMAKDSYCVFGSNQSVEQASTKFNKKTIV